MSILPKVRERLDAGSINGQPGFGTGVLSRVFLFFGIGFTGLSWGALTNGHMLQLSVLGSLAAIFYTITYLLAYGHRSGWQRRIDAMSGPKVIWFRPFDFDLNNLVGRHAMLSPSMFVFKALYRIEVSLEEMLAAMSHQHNLQAITFGEKIKRFGPSTCVTTDDNWEKTVLHEMQTARLIFVVPSAREGTFKEMELIFANGLEARAIFLMPSQKIVKRAYDMKASWENVTARVKAHASMPNHFPDYSEDGILFSYAKSWNTYVLHCKPLTPGMLEAVIAHGAQI